MNIKVYIFLVLFFGCKALFSQINIGGKPYSFSNISKLKSQKKLPTIYLPAQNNKSLTYEAERNSTKDKPFQFGKNIKIDLNVKELALKEQLPKGKLYRLKIISKNALTLNLTFSKFKIPKHALLYIYNAEKTDVIGGFTSKNMQKGGRFSTGLLKGDAIVIEYYEPDFFDFSGTLILDRITHGFRDIPFIDKGFGSSGSCNMNVACDDALPYSKEVNSVCMLLTGGNGFCSAALINNTKSDGKPYILTANHCYENPEDLVFMFNWQSAQCENPAVSPSHDDLSGAVLRARNSESDFCLFELNDIPPYSYNVYYAGWNREEKPASKTVCIHHPRSDIKKISFDDDTCFSDSYLGQTGLAESYWKVIWNRNTTTEAGSSGSPLFNQDHKIIGQLHGGFASCSNPLEPDWFGKLSYSWDGNTSASRLKDYLDPLNSGVYEFEGYDPNVPLANIDAQVLMINAPKTNYFGAQRFKPSVTIRNRGNTPLTEIKISYQVDKSAIINKNWFGTLATGEIDSVEFDEIALNFSEHHIKFWTSSPNGINDEYLHNDTLQKTFYIYETVFFDDFETAQTWDLCGEFQIASPQGLGGEKGYPDPEFAYSGTQVLGTDLSGMGKHPGDYENNLGYDDTYAISPLIDCRNYENCLLTFVRKLGADKYKYDKFTIQIKSDSCNWKKLWRNKNTLIKDSVWTKQVFDISDIADRKRIKIKFTAGPTNHADQYCGWNIDDFIIAGTAIKNTKPSVNSGILLYPNPAKDFFYLEFNTDKTIDFADILIADLSGRIIVKKRIPAQELKNIAGSQSNKKLLKIDLPKHKKGIFTVQVKTNTEHAAFKILLKD